MSELLIRIGPDLKQARAAKGWSQRKLARETGLTQGQVSRIEAGQVDVRISTLSLLSRALDMTIELVPSHQAWQLRRLLSDHDADSPAPLFSLDDE